MYELSECLIWDPEGILEKQIKNKKEEKGFLVILWRQDYHRNVMGITETRCSNVCLPPKLCCQRVSVCWDVSHSKCSSLGFLTSSLLTLIFGGVNYRGRCTIWEVFQLHTWNVECSALWASSRVFSLSYIQPGCKGSPPKWSQKPFSRRK